VHNLVLRWVKRESGGVREPRRQKVGECEVKGKSRVGKREKILELSRKESRGGVWLSKYAEQKIQEERGQQRRNYVGGGYLVNQRN